MNKKNFIIWLLAIIVLPVLLTAYYNDYEPFHFINTIETSPFLIACYAACLIPTFIILLLKLKDEQFRIPFLLIALQSHFATTVTYFSFKATGGLASSSTAAIGLIVFPILVAPYCLVHDVLQILIHKINSRKSESVNHLGSILIFAVFVIFAFVFNFCLQIQSLLLLLFNLIKNIFSPEIYHSPFKG